MLFLNFHTIKIASLLNDAKALNLNYKESLALRNSEIKWVIL